MKTMLVPYLPLSRIFETENQQMVQSLQTVLHSGQYILSEAVKQFEVQFANYCGAKYCIGVGNGFDALYIILEGYKSQGMLKKGDEVLVNAHTFIASISAIIRAELIPILIEPDTETYLMDVSELPQKLSSKTKALVVVHMFGYLSNMDAISAFCNVNDLLLIEDAAQAHGAEYLNQKAGSWGHAAAFSFYPTKNLSALGDAGAIVTSEDDLAKFAESFRNYGKNNHNLYQRMGINSRLDSLQAVWLSYKLTLLDRENDLRRKYALKYCTEIVHPHVLLPIYPDDTSHVWYAFVIKTNHRSALQHYLNGHGIETHIHYPVPAHQQIAIIPFLNQTVFPVTENLYQQILSLPLSPYHTLNEIQTVINQINAWE